MCLMRSKLVLIVVSVILKPFEHLIPILTQMRDVEEVRAGDLEDTLALESAGGGLCERP